MNILLGITGGVAAYKMLSVASLLIKKGHEVEVCMTKEARKFVTPLSFEALTHKKVILKDSDFLHDCTNQHIALAQWCDLYIISPATANTIAKLANGISDNIVTLTAIATNKLKLVMPAMNNIMYESQINNENIEKLKNMDGYKILEPSEGYLACGTIGKGRLLEPKELVEAIEYYYGLTDDLLGKKVLINAGATKEDIDPIRYITNRSSGKMGYALAKVCAQMGAIVTLVTASDLDVSYGVEKIIKVRTSKQMKEAMLSEVYDNDIVICAAAVSDYRPKVYLNNKMKKTDEDLSLLLSRTDDILEEICKNKKQKIVVGFAMETQDLLSNAKLKLEKKNLDYIVANGITDNNKIFGLDYNDVTILGHNNIEKKVCGSKIEVARKIIEAVIDGGLK